MTNTEENSYEFNSYVDLQWIDSSILNYRSSTLEDIKRWVSDPVIYNQQIRDVSKYLYFSNGVYSRVINYMVSLPTLDHIVYELQKSKKSHKNIDKFNDALRVSKHKLIVRDILLKLGIEGTYFGYLETNEQPKTQGSFSNDELRYINEINTNEIIKCSVLTLPSNYCKIVGTKDTSYVSAFDLSYFDQYRTNGLANKLRKYPKEIRNAYQKYLKERNKNWYVMDNDKTITLKVGVNISDQWGIPRGLQAFVDILFDQLFSDTKRNVIDETNGNLVVHTFPESNEKGQSTLTLTQQKNQHESLKKALFARRNSNGQNLVSLAAGTKLENIEVDSDILTKIKDEDLLKKISTDLGFAVSALNGDKGNYSSQQTNLNLITAEVFTWLEQIVEELNKVINLNVIKDMKNPIILTYLPITHLNRNEKIGHMKDLYTHAGGSLMAWISSIGIPPEAYLSLMDREREEKFDQKYPVHQTSFTQSNNDKKPENLNPESEHTVKTKTNNNNENPAPSKEKG
ncbi:hypothetical protein G7L40_00535 [Paenibacillus polymyxa]|nr:hypothetical protein [Paenibacillus polymyxa]UOD88763.1 hypothetical protein CUU60_24265 [Paenibacillus polymyxa ATCC 842]MBG9763141.1 hypothetical protein [Paenibacillus polymyxa]QPK56001.1 hypothetical protein G7035_00535 [Paenibacillus polymyxa]QPK61081.1 hypothetical protein G7L40_00535 [Paenibacillus polymyxa]